MMLTATRFRISLSAAAAAVVLAGALFAAVANPYHMTEGWAKLPDGRKIGATGAVSVDRSGNVWVFERCGENSCAGSKVAPILKFDATGKLLTSFGAGVFVYPHGLHLDREGNVWVSDALAKDGKGQQVFKFSPDGKLLLTLGKAGVTGSGPDTFNQPSSIAVAGNGDIFVGDGHGGDTNARVVKFSKDGKFIKEWGKQGTGPGEFETPHAMAFDSTGHLFVGDRGNGRIQIFDQNGRFLMEWKQFGRPSGIFIDAYDNLYVTDSQSNEKNNPGFTQGIRIGSTKDGVVRMMIPALGPEQNPTSVTEGVAADMQGSVYGAETRSQNLRKYMRN